MPPKLPKPVPWHSPAEFIQVHQWFYPLPTEDGSPDIRAQECAIRRVRKQTLIQGEGSVEISLIDWQQEIVSKEDKELIIVLIYASLT